MMTKVFCKSRKGRSSDDSKRRLVNAAVDIFSKLGFDGATTRAIAKKAGVNSSLIQRYYGGKIGLLFALFNDFGARLPEISLGSTAANVETVLETFLRSRLDRSRKHKKLIKILLSQAMINSIFRRDVSELSKRDNPILAQRIRDLQSSGEIDETLDCNQVCRFLNILPVSLSLLTEITSSLDPEYAEEFIQIAVMLISRGLKRSERVD
jgi:AcrR family transcriptional regulator